MSAPAAVTRAPTGSLRAAMDGVRAVFGPDPAAVAWGLSARRIGWFGTYRYSGTPRPYVGLARRIDADAEPMCSAAPAGSPGTWTGGWL